MENIIVFPFSWLLPVSGREMAPEEHGFPQFAHGNTNTSILHCGNKLSIWLRAGTYAKINYTAKLQQ
jgi:hypothetical protein